MSPDNPSTSPTPDRPRTGRRWLWLTIFMAALTGVVAVAVTALLVNIFEHKQEARNPFFRVVELTDDTIDPAVWGKDFPFQYDAYLRTVDMARTSYGGSEAMRRTPTESDPRAVVSQSRLDEDPRLKTIFAGYAFAQDFRKKRGHAYMLDDQLYTERQKAAQQPGTCIHCHASVYVPYKLAGGGDIIKGFEFFNHMKYGDAKKAMEDLLAKHGQKLHPVACIDCHDPQTMALRITRPGFIEGLRALKAGQGVVDYDVNATATRQEMRSYVCGQCHVEYYFKGPEKRLTYPWAKGLKADEILAYYDETGFRDWVHAESGAPVLKAQHPEFEMWNQGIHARSGVACADCHMPYTRIGAMKVSDHNVRSPLLNVNNACQTCHKFSEKELMDRATTIQRRHKELTSLAMNAAVELIGDLKAAQAGGANDEQLKPARDFQRKAQFLLDFCEAENSNGFHAGQEAARLLGKSLDYARRGQVALRSPPAGSTTTQAAGQ